VRLVLGELSEQTNLLYRSRIPAIEAVELPVAERLVMAFVPGFQESGLSLPVAGPWALRFESRGQHGI